MPSITVKKKSPESQDNKLVIVVGKKVSKRATERNLIKRRIRSIFKELTKNNNKKYTVIVRPEALNLKFSELKEEIKKQIN